MRSIMRYVTRSALLALLALSVAGCTLGGDQVPTPVVPVPAATDTLAVATQTVQVPTSTAMPLPTTVPTESVAPTEPADTPTPGPTPPGAAGQSITGRVMVESVEVRISESLPVQVSVNVKGNLADACTKPDEVSIARDGNAFNVGITTTRPADVVCAEVLTPYEENIELDVKGLKKGTYTVTVNGVTQSFELAADN